MNTKIKTEFFTILVFINVCLVVFAGCIKEDKKPEFTLVSWKTEVDNSSEKLFMLIEFETEIEKGLMDLYSPSGKLIDSKCIDKNKQNLSFFIGRSKSEKLQSGNYMLTVKTNETDTDDIILNEVIIVKESNISIIECIPKWWYHEIYEYFELTDIKITLKNDGDLSGFILEGKVIVDNTSTFIAPDYHWHDLNIWIMPNEEASLELPVKVPWLMQGSHFISILMQDKILNYVTLYETIVRTPEFNK